MWLITKIKEIINKIKDYDRLERDYCIVLDMVTGSRLSMPCYKIESVRNAFNEFLSDRNKEAYDLGKKDNELTWKDIELIDKLLWELCSDYKNEDDGQRFFQEVLKQFKSAKKQKEFIRCFKQI